MSSESTALARTEGRQELDNIRQRGAHKMAKRDMLNDLARECQATEWGAALPQNSLAAMALYCHTTEARPHEVFLLGTGKKARPYLAAEYAERRMNEHPSHVSHELVNISDDQAERRKWGIPEGHKAAWVARIRRFVPMAPIHAIRAGKIPHDEAMKWTRVSEEANSTGGRTGDPVGNSVDNMHKTCRTRALRRCFMKTYNAFSSLVYEAEGRAIETLEAQWEDITDADAEVQDGVAVIGDGEPKALPAETAPEPEPAEDPALLTDGRRRYFATLREMNLADDDKRKGWQKSHNFPESVTDWKLADFEKADRILLTPVRTAVAKLCEETETDLEVLSDALWGKAAPDYAKEWMEAYRSLERKKKRQEEAAAAEAERQAAAEQLGPLGQPDLDF